MLSVVPQCLLPPHCSSLCVEQAFQRAPGGKPHCSIMHTYGSAWSGMHIWCRRPGSSRFEIVWHGTADASVCGRSAAQQHDAKQNDIPAQCLYCFLPQAQRSAQLETLVPFFPSCHWRLRYAIQRSYRKTRQKVRCIPNNYRPFSYMRRALICVYLLLLVDTLHITLLVRRCIQFAPFLCAVCLCFGACIPLYSSLQAQRVWLSVIQFALCANLGS